MMSEFRAALQALVTAFEENPPESIIDPGCYQCSEEMDAGEKAYMCTYHAAYSSAKALLARPERINRPETGDGFTQRMQAERLENASNRRYPAPPKDPQPGDYEPGDGAPAQSEPEPRITREEAEKLLDEYRLATEIMGNGVGFSSASREALIKMRNDAREACLAAMLRTEPADPYGKPCTCGNTLGSGYLCYVAAGGKLGQLWYCRKAVEAADRAIVGPATARSEPSSRVDEYFKEKYRALDQQHRAAEQPQPVAWVPIHPLLGPIWANTIDSLDSDHPNSYELMPLYAAPTENAKQSQVIADLAMMMRQLVYALNKAIPDTSVAYRAMKLLEKHGLQGSILRDASAPAASDGEKL